MNLLKINAVLAPVILLGCLVMTGCDSKTQKQQAADQETVAKLQEMSKKNKDRIAEQLESNDGFMPGSTDDLGEILEVMESSAEGLSPELAAQLKSQAAILQEVKDLMDPYVGLNNAFMELGGIEASTLGSVDDINNRISMVEQLNAMNETIAGRFPVLFMQIEGADTPQGQRQLAMSIEIRQADREAYPHMKRCLEIVRKYRETSGNADDGNFYFGDDVPGEVIAEYNEHMAAIAAIGERQLEIQRKNYSNP